MESSEARTLIDAAPASTRRPIIGALTLAAHRKYAAYEIWVWLDNAGNEHVSKVMGRTGRGRRFGWSPDSLDRGRSFIDSNKIPRVTADQPATS